MEAVEEEEEEEEGGKLESGISAKLLKISCRKREDKTSGGKRDDSGPAESARVVEEEGPAAVEERVAGVREDEEGEKPAVVGVASEQVDDVNPSFIGARECREEEEAFLLGGSTEEAREVGVAPLSRPVTTYSRIINAVPVETVCFEDKAVYTTESV